MGPNRLATDRPDLLKFHHNGHTHYTAGQTEEQGEQDKTYLRTRQRKFWGENFPSTPLPPLRASLLLGVENQSPSESSLHQFYHPHGEGSGTPLQYSCLENPMDGGAWSAAVHGVVKSWTHLSDFTFTHWRRKWQPTPVFLPGESQGQGAWRAAVYGVAQSRTRLK